MNPEWGFPDSDICVAAERLAFEVAPTVIANHCVRSYLFARELAAADGLRSGVDYDDELVFLACLLHDLGITEHGGGDQRFEVDGADAAARFLREHGLADDRIRTVWQSIALHSSVGLAHRFGPEQALSFAGISLDVDGMARGRLPEGFADRVHAAWPRHDLGYALAELIAAGAAANPMKAPPFTLPAHLHEMFNGSSFTFLELVKNSPWGDRVPVTPRSTNPAARSSEP
ncbi:HD domain-containing protein [Mycolicibacterium sp. F2034L]|uniref:HD domain-containing protein n=1 Tax=Mycolicibacterium sp. F2034L TaxID=2926422 RepID=UPI001FF5CBCD|nr:HD domain-containing protein [Mycolicibacterium sp. F2034L]MCK0173013.1 HD domain-containing protein [Mycolicibacterium sp. F2034L]